MIRIAVVNLDWQRGHNKELLHQACTGADVVLVCEALAANGKQPEVLAPILPDGWQCFQDTSSLARAGSAVCWRTAVMSEKRAEHSRQVTRAARKGFRVRERYIASIMLTYKATGGSRRYAAFHAPLRTTGRQGEFYSFLARWVAQHPHAVAGGDGNRAPKWVTGRTGRKAVGREVISLLLPHDLADTAAHKVTSAKSPWTDHPIVRVLLDPRRRA